MTRNQHLLLTFAFVAMGMVGWRVDGNSAGNAAAPMVRPGPPRRSSPSEQRDRALPGPTGEFADRLAAIGAIRDPQERTRATLDLANHLPVAEFAAWLDGGWFRPGEGSDAILFKGTLLERWRGEDSAGMLAWCLKDSSREDDPLVATSIETRPQQFLDFYKLHPDDVAEMRVLSEIAAKNPGLALQRLQEMAAAGRSPEFLAFVDDVLLKIAEQSFAGLETALGSLPPPWQLAVEACLIGQKMRSGFSAEFAKLLDRPDGFELFRRIAETDSIEVGGILDELENLPSSWLAGIADSPDGIVIRTNPEKWVTADLEGAGFTAEQARSIRSAAIGCLEANQPETALKLMVDADLTADERLKYLEQIFTRLQGEPEKAESLVALLTSDEDRQIARESVVREPEIAPIEKPSEWLDAVAALEADHSISSEYFAMLQRWDDDKIADLARRIEFLPDDNKSQIFKIMIADFRDPFAEHKPLLEGEAIRYFTAHPPETPLLPKDPDQNYRWAPRDIPLTKQEFVAEQTIELASRYVGDLASSDPTTASVWIQSLPAGDAKLWASKNLHTVWSQYDPQAADQWMDSLPPAVQSQVKSLGKKPAD